MERYIERCLSNIHVGKLDLKIDYRTSFKLETSAIQVQRQPRWHKFNKKIIIVDPIVFGVKE